LVQPFGGYNLSVKSKGSAKAATLWHWKERKNHKEKIEKIEKAVDKRNADTTEFLIDLQTSYYQDMLNFFHEKLKYKGLITSGNWRGSHDANLLDAERATYRFDDVVDNHHYVSPAHINPNEPGIASWDVRVGDCYQSMSALKAPWIMPNSFKQFLGKPNIISECTWSNPNVYQLEAPMLVAAYACLNGLDSFNWFSVYVPGFESRVKKFPVAVPNIMGQFPAMALLYRKGYVKEAPVVAHEDRTIADICNKKMPVMGESFGYDPTRDKDGLSTELSELSFGKFPLAYCVGRVTWKVADKASNFVDAKLTDCINKTNKEVKSITKQLTLNWEKGLFTVNAPKAQGVTGFMKDNGKISLDDISIKMNHKFAAIIVVPLDDKPLAKSKKMLVQAVVNSLPHGYKEEPTTFKQKKNSKVELKGMKIINCGGAPYNVPFINASVEFKNPVKTAIALDGNGYPIKDTKIKIEGNKITLPKNAIYTIVTR
jgi:hypothetical protein